MSGPDDSVPEEGVISPSPPPRRPRRRWRWVGGGVLLAGALVTGWFALPIRKVETGGQTRLSGPEIRELAGLTPGFGWLYYGAWQARGLLDDPWVRSVRVVRRFPDTVMVEVTEHRPVARWRNTNGTVLAVTADGTALPITPRHNADVAGVPVIQGWGPSRLGDALKVLEALGRYNVQSVAYTPTGLRAKLSAGSVWSGDLKSLLKYAGSITMYPKQNLNIYPWGVSVQE